MKLVLVEWNDACSGTGWDNRGHEEHTDRIISVGILSRKNDNEIELIPNLGPAHKLHQIALNNGSIKRIRQIAVLPRVIKL